MADQKPEKIQNPDVNHHTNGTHNLDLALQTLSKEENSIFNNIFKTSHLEGVVILTSTSSLTLKTIVAIFRITGSRKNFLKQKTFIHEKLNYELWSLHCMKLVKKFSCNFCLHNIVFQKQVWQTLSKASEHFFFLNLGITFIHKCFEVWPP